MKEQKLIVKRHEGADLYHFLVSPHSIESLSSYLSVGWVVKLHWKIVGCDSEVFLMERAK